MKKKRRSPLFLPISLLVDTLTINLGLGFGQFYEYHTFSLPIASNGALLFWIFNTLWFLLLLLMKPYREPRISFGISKLLYNFYLLLLIHATLIVIFWTNSENKPFDLELLFFSYFIAGALGTALRIIGVFLLRGLRRDGFNIRNYIVIGRGDLSSSIVNYYKLHPEMGYNFMGYFGQGDLDTVEDFVLKNEIDYIYCCLPDLNHNQIDRITNISKDNNVSLKVIMDYRSFAKNGLSIEYHGHLPIINVSMTPHHDFKSVIVKRLFDILFSLSVLIIGSPILLIVALITKLSSRGPIFYYSERVGLWGKKFFMMKYRSMNVEASSRTQIVLTEANGDLRVTKWGKFMRKTRLDELPQFLNVLKGEMSIVGPRPGIPSYNEAVLKIAPEFQKLLTIKPGVTSIGQINFGYAETPEEMVKRMKYDLIYLNNSSLRTDIWVIFLTAKTMIQGKGQ
jgi:exopolysaccharide biosynthesis polyprenyl glycosylphosphotransferase